jgi:16S rRNA C1402 (ribose-2'-O) methylase RsmI
MRSHLDEVQLIAKLADLKESHYKTTLLLHAVMHVLMEKQVLTPEELAAKVEEIDRMPLSAVSTLHSDRPNA